jgi:hypothetical protein
MRFVAWRAACVVFLNVASTKLALAQRPQTDSAIVRITLDAVFSEMSRELADAVIDARTSAWSIDLPKTNAVWVSAAENVGRILGRTPVASDRDEHYLTIREQLVTDTLRTFQITVGQKWRCGGRSDRWVASDRTFEVRLAMRDHLWQRIASNSLLVYGDPAICEP